MKAKKLACYLLAILPAGCVPVVSLHPLFTRENLVFEEKLVGTWVKDPNDPEVTWAFSRLEESAAKGPLESWREDITKFYRLDITDQDGRKGSFAACLVKLGDRLLDLVDLFANLSGKGTPFQIGKAHDYLHGIPYVITENCKLFDVLLDLLVGEPFFLLDHPGPGDVTHDGHYPCNMLLFKDRDMAVLEKIASPVEMEIYGRLEDLPGRKDVFYGF